MMSLWDALRMNMMISYQELVRTFLSLLDKAPSASMQQRFAEADAHYHTPPPVRATAE